MGFTRTNTRLILLFLAAAAFSFLAVSEAKTVMVGGSENWRPGFNYTDWAVKTSPFFINDTLVFKYDPPSSNGGNGYNVYLLPNLWSFIKCDFRRAKLVADSTQGSGDGFSYVLKQGKPLYFASAGDRGSQCTDGMMKFFAVPLPR